MESCRSSLTILVVQNLIINGFRLRNRSGGTFRFLLFGLLLALVSVSAYSQGFNQQQYFAPQQNRNFMANSTAFRQEIARMEITVHREGRLPLSLTQVPRVQQGDTLKVKLLDEPVNGIKLDQSMYDWTLVVAFINPVRNKDKEGSVSQEVQFRKKGWYREHSFAVPYDSQPVFFMYPRPNYRSKIQGLIAKNYNEVRKLGEKTIELAGAYAQIGMFLNELQGVLSGNSYNPYGYGNSGTYGGYQSYGGYGNYNQYSPYGNRSYNYNLLTAQSVERLARSFNIQLPQNCWQNGLGLTGGYGSYGGGLNQFGVSQDMVGRLQCVAKNVRLEDFDVSVSRLLQQGGILAAAQLTQKYPQIAYWINIAAVAIDLILKITKKTPLRIVPAVSSSTDNQQNTYGVQSYNGYSPGGNTGATGQQQQVKISVFAESQPDDSQFITAYPIVLHKWQAEADPEVLSLRPPVLLEPCLHPGQNILKNTDLTEDQLSDQFTKDYTLVMSSTNGFRKEFPLKKNVGLGGWELNITPQDMQAFPKIQMTLESIIKGTRGFSEITSPVFNLPIAVGGNWEVDAVSQKDFSVGGRRTVTLRNNLGNCQCLQSVVYKPSFGGQFAFENPAGGSQEQNALQFSPDGKEVSFVVDATNFQPGQGQIELRTYGGEMVTLNLKLYAAPPAIRDYKIKRGDREILLTGDRLEQVQAVLINGKRAVNPYPQTMTPSNNFGNNGFNNQPAYPVYGTQPGNVQPTPNQTTVKPSENYPPGTLSQNQKVFVFEDPNSVIEGNQVSLEVFMEDNRSFAFPQRLTTSESRPMIKTEAGVLTAVSAETDRWLSVPIKTSTTSKTPPANPLLAVNRLAFSINDLFPIDANNISVIARNALTDYDFKTENIRIETSIEGSVVTPDQLPQVTFEVLDPMNMRINLAISENARKYLGGRKLRLRLVDRQRGNSDWYTIRQPFVRFPKLESVVCGATQGTSNCQLSGAGLDYIQQVSIDGGQTWFPALPGSLQAQLTGDGKSSAIIPMLANKNSLKLKLRDYPTGDGMFVDGFTYSNQAPKPTAVKGKKN